MAAPIVARLALAQVASLSLPRFEDYQVTDIFAGPLLRLFKGPPEERSFTPEYWRS